MSGLLYLQKKVSCTKNWNNDNAWSESTKTSQINETSKSETKTDCSEYDNNQRNENRTKNPNKQLKNGRGKSNEDTTSVAIFSWVRIDKRMLKRKWNIQYETFDTTSEL